MQEAANTVSDMLATAGLEVERFSNGASPPILVARGGAGNRCLMIYNHYDVQPPDPLDEWLSPPFEPQTRDGKLFARGVADNKADLVARLAAIRLYSETVGPLPARVLYVVEGEEEVGSPFLFHFGEEQGALLSQADGCLWEFGSKNADENPVICLGVKGMTAFDLRVRTAALDAHSGNGGIFPNAAWRLAEALNSLRAPDGRLIIDGLLDHVRQPTEVEERLLEAIPFNQEALQASVRLHQRPAGRPDRPSRRATLADGTSPERQRPGERLQRSRLQNGDTGAGNGQDGHAAGARADAPDCACLAARTPGPARLQRCGDHRPQRLA